MPIMSARTKLKVELPPKRSMAKRTMRVVDMVFNERVIVSDMELLMMDLMSRE